MHQTGTNMIARKVLWYEASAIFFIMAIIWIDEILDIPYVLLGGPPTLQIPDDPGHGFHVIPAGDSI